MRVHNLSLDVISHVRETCHCDYGVALRLVQLYGFLEYLQMAGGAAQFSAAAYSRKTGCHRTTLRQDMAALASHGWITITRTARGQVVRVHPIQFAVNQDVPLAPEEPIEAPPPAPQPEAPAQPVAQTFVCSVCEGDPPGPGYFRTRWNADRREKIRRIWNEHRPPNFAELPERALDPARAEALAKIMTGRGGYTELVEQLPAVLAQIRRNEFWGDPKKSFRFDQFIGTARSPKGHLANALDSLKSSACQPPQPDRPSIRYEPFGDQWIPLRPLTADETVVEGVRLVRSGAAPESSLRFLPGWRPDHPALN